jgi:hypothetical protein
LKRITIVLTVAALLSFFWILGIPIIFSAATGVPYWFLFPLHQLSVAPSQGVMSVKINSTAPMLVGEHILVTVLDAGNNTPIGDASVKIVFNGIDYYKTTTNLDGTAQFPYPGATTVIYVSKDGYQDAEPIPLPQIPDSWVTTRDYQTITWVLGLLGTWGPVFYFYKKQQKRLPAKRRGQKKSGE